MGKKATAPKPSEPKRDDETGKTVLCRTAAGEVVTGREVMKPMDDHLLNPLKNKKHLDHFEGCAETASANMFSDAFTRVMLMSIIRTCPSELLTEIGRCIVKRRREELQTEAGNN